MRGISTTKTVKVLWYEESKFVTDFNLDCAHRKIASNFAVRKRGPMSEFFYGK